MSPLSGTTGRRLAAAVAVLSLATLAACGSTSSAKGGGAGGSSGSQVDPKISADLTALAKPITNWPGIKPIANPVSVKGKRITLIPLSSSVAILGGMVRAEETALKHLGAIPTVCDGKGDPSTIAGCLQQAQSGHAFAVLTDFVAYQMVPNSFDSLAASGAKVLIGGDEPTPGKTYNPNIKFLNGSTALTPMFKNEAEAAVADKGTSAGVLWLRDTDTADQSAAADNGLAYLKSICPTCQVVTQNFTTANVNNLPSQVSADLVSHPKIDVLVSPVDSFVGPAWQGVQSAGFATKVEVISTGSDIDGLQRVKSGQEAHDFGASALYDGYAALNGLMQDLAGETVTPSITVTRDFGKDNVGSLKLTAAEYNTAHWFGNDSFVEKFYQAWGAK